MQPQTVFPALLRESTQILDGVDAACFRGLTDGDGTRLRVMNVRSTGSDQVHRGRREFPVVAFCSKELGTIGKKLGSTAFVGLHVGRLTADNRVVRLAERSQRQRIGRGAIEGKENLAVSLKHFPKSIGCSRGPGVVSVARDVAMIGGFHGGPRLRTDAGIIVACELLQKIGALDISHTLTLILGTSPTKPPRYPSPTPDYPMGAHRSPPAPE